MMHGLINTRFKASNVESLAALENALDNFGITYTAIGARGGTVG